MFALWNCVIVFHSLPQRAEYVVDPLHATKPILTFFIGKGEYIPKKDHFVNRFGTLFNRFSPKVALFGTVECFLSLTLSVIEGVRADNLVQCGHKRLAMGLCMLFYAGVVGFITPARRPRDDVIEVINDLISCVGLVCLALAYYSGDSNHLGYSLANDLFTVVSYSLLIKSILDLLTVVYVVLTKRRDRLMNKSQPPVPADNLTRIDKKVPKMPTLQLRRGSIIRDDVEDDYAHLSKFKFGSSETHSEAELVSLHNDSDTPVHQISMAYLTSPRRSSSPATFGLGAGPRRYSSLPSGLPPRSTSRRKSSYRYAAPPTRKRRLSQGLGSITPVDV